MRSFHRQGPIVNPAVLAVLSKFENTCNIPGRQLVGLTRSMLSIQEEERPSALEVTQRLQSIAINDLLCTITQQYTKLLATTAALPALVENQRFKSWEYVLGFIDNLEDRKVESVAFDLDFEKCFEILQATCTEPDRVISGYDAAAYPIFIELQSLNDRLKDTLPDYLQRRALSCLEYWLLEAKDSSLDDTGGSPNYFESAHSKTPLLRFIRQLSQQVDKHATAFNEERKRQNKPSLEVKEIDVNFEGRFREHNLGSICDITLNASKRVLIEWIQYSTHWEGKI